MKHIKDSFFFKSNKKIIIALIGVLGVFLIAISYVKEAEPDGIHTAYYGNSELDEYGSMIENKLEDTLSAVTGKDTVEVMITFSGTFENVYRDSYSFSSDRNFDIDTAYAFSSDNKKDDGVIKRLCPKIAGVMIVCKTKLDPNGYSAIKKAASTALNVSESKICIIGGEEKHEKSN